MNGYKVISNLSQIGELIDLLHLDSPISLDTETTGLDYFTCKLLLLQIKVREQVLIFDIRKLKKNEVTYIVSLIKESKKLVIGHNIKFDIKVLYVKTGVLLENVYDTMLGEVLTYNGNGNQYPSLEDVCLRYCNVKLEKEVRNTFIDLPDNQEITEQQFMYSALDVDHLRNIWERQTGLLAEQKQLAVAELEMADLAPICKAEINGVIIDRTAWMDNYNKYLSSAKEVEQKLLKYIYDKINKDKFKNVYEFANALSIPVKTKKLITELESLSVDFAEQFFMSNFNLGSSKQVKTVLWMIGVQVENTNEKTLKDFKSDEPAIDMLLELREYEKKVSTYGEEFLNKNIHPVTGKVHTEFNQLGTATGRMSSNSPNLQNIPKDKAYRKAFVAPEGYKFITADYSQAELRLLTEVCGDPEMIDAYLHDADLHAKSAAAMYGIPIEEVQDFQRQKGKTLNFGVVYGISEYGLWRNFGIPVEEGKVFLQKYFELYKILRKFLDLAGDKICELKYSVTPMGRKRFFEDKTFFTDSKDYRKYDGSMRREGLNHIIQGGISDVVKYAIKFIYYENPYGDDLTIVLQVHDELVVQAKDEIADEALEFVKDCMLRAEKLFIKRIPVKVDIKKDQSWTK